MFRHHTDSPGSCCLPDRTCRSSVWTWASYFRPSLRNPSTCSPGNRPSGEPSARHHADPKAKMSRTFSSLHDAGIRFCLEGGRTYNKFEIWPNRRNMYPISEQKAVPSAFRLAMLDNDTFWGDTYLYGLYWWPPPGFSSANTPFIPVSRVPICFFGFFFHSTIHSLNIKTIFTVDNHLFIVYDLQGFRVIGSKANAYHNPRVKWHIPSSHAHLRGLTKWLRFFSEWSIFPLYVFLGNQGNRFIKQINMGKGFTGIYCIQLRRGAILNDNWRQIKNTVLRRANYCGWCRHWWIRLWFWRCPVDAVCCLTGCVFFYAMQTIRMQNKNGTTEISNVALRKLGIIQVRRRPRDLKRTATRWLFSFFVTGSVFC